MEESEQVSSLVGDIYDAALDETRWPSALSKLADFVGGPAAALYAKDNVSKTAMFPTLLVSSQITWKAISRPMSVSIHSQRALFLPSGASS
jgi:hypothetical protein